MLKFKLGNNSWKILNHKIRNINVINVIIHIKVSTVLEDIKNNRSMINLLIKILLLNYNKV